MIPSGIILVTCTMYTDFWPVDFPISEYVWSIEHQRVQFCKSFGLSLSPWKITSIVNVQPNYMNSMSGHNFFSIGPGDISFCDSRTVHPPYCPDDIPTNGSEYSDKISIGVKGLEKLRGPWYTIVG